MTQRTDFAQMRQTFVILSVLTLGLSACSEFPELEDTVDSSASYPSLVPIETLTSKAPDPQIKPETAPDLESRVARLKARAANLQRDVVDDETHARMDAGVE